MVRARGDLERAVMEVLWADRSPQAGRDVLVALGDPDLAYNTVVTVLDRLVKKGVVRRERDGRSWSYRAASGRAEHVAALMLEALDRAGDRTAALVHFAREVSGPDAAALRAALDADRPDAS